MITLYSTFCTATLRQLRSTLLSALGANLASHNRAAYLRVELMGHLRLLNGWSSLFDVTKPAVDDDASPAVDTRGIAAAFIGNQPIGEQYRWSPGIRRSRFVRTT